MSSQDTHGLTVQDIARQAEDAVTITLGIPPRSRDAFRHQPGQYLMVRHPAVGAEEDFRSYSICHAPPTADTAPETLRIGVRLLGPGGFSAFAHERLSPGDTVAALPPTGRFRLRPGPRHLAVAAGSGITPVLAMAQAALARGDEFTLLYGNRTTASTMFAPEIAELEHRFPDRFSALHVLSREHHPAPARTGRIDTSSLPALLDAAGWTAADQETQFYLCGPAGMVGDVRSFLTTVGVERRRVHSELFAVSAPGLQSTKK